MSLSLGALLGAYEIVAPLGAGGMGEVYRDRDTKLNREAAIKVLPDLFATDVERLARFTREAQTLASLNHPNIAQIYGVEESDGAGPRHGTGGRARPVRDHRARPRAARRCAADGEADCRGA